MTIFLTSVGATTCLMRSPVANFDDVVIIDYFRAPKCEQCSGNRGIELQINADEPIFAVADGVISFRGEVNRTKYLVLLTTNNRRITYGKVAEIKVRAGERVVAGQQIAKSGPNLYFGIREFSGGVAQYLDPMKFLANATTNHARAVLISDEDGFTRTRNPLNLQC
ncbi:MAG: M23 family metallopeptidase [Actinomycetota bacterium]|nr:M23 family metallopeptidase [Actinomycetota bacterium]